MNISTIHVSLYSLLRILFYVNIAVLIIFAFSLKEKKGVNTLKNAKTEQKQHNSSPSEMHLHLRCYKPQLRRQSSGLQEMANTANYEENTDSVCI